MIDMENVVAGYGGAPVMDGVSLSVDAGEVVAVVGRNGAGKTTAVRVLTGQLPATSGSVRLFGLDAWRDRARIMARTGVVPEAVDLPREMSLGRLDRLLRRLYTRWDRASVARRIERARIGSDARLSRLSRGQLRQAMLALALAPAPDLVILDDVTQGLDPVARRRLLDELIADLADRGTTVLITSHDLDAVARVASRVAVLRRGRLVLDVDTDELPRRIRLVRAAATEDALDLALQPFRVMVTRHRAGEARVLVDTDGEGDLRHALDNAGLASAEVVPVSLEEVVIDLLEEEAS